MNHTNDIHMEETDKPYFADLHVHSLFSDGVLHPRRIVQKAAETGLKAISITDHDCLDGIEPALDEGKKLGVEIIPGVELTAMCNDQEIHILGYFFDPFNKELAVMIRYFKQQRMIRYQRILCHLEKAGVEIKPEYLEQVSIQSTIGRLHIAEALVNSGVTATIQNAFRYYLGKGALAYEEKCSITPGTMIELIRSAGGVSVLAHPSMYFKENDLMDMIRNGLNGIETIHPKMDQPTRSYFQRIVSQYGLLETGGSDSHGRKGFAEIGDYKTPYQNVLNMKQFIARERSAV